MRSNLIKKVGCLEIVPMKSGEIEWCVANHLSKSEGKKMGVNRLYIIDRYAGSLCGVCTKEWLRNWKDLTGEPEVHIRNGKAKVVTA
jgi:hypothetical protein